MVKKYTFEIIRRFWPNDTSHDANAMVEHTQNLKWLCEMQKNNSRSFILKLTDIQLFKNDYIAFYEECGVCLSAFTQLDATSKDYSFNELCCDHYLAPAMPNIIDGIRFLHELDCVYGDLHPDNIVFTKDYDKARVMLYIRQWHHPNQARRCGG